MVCASDAQRLALSPIGCDNRRTLRVFSGIQPTGAKHFGNYSGGFRQYVATQQMAEALFCIVDLHSITVAYDAGDLRARCIDLAAMLFATGLDPKRSIVFAQSHVSAHAEAAWLLSAVATFGELRRMTQFKDKSESQASITSGLFTYPVLMAGDILLYQTDVVPIGQDQQQHVELARDLAERFNARFGETFRLPRGQYPKAGARIMDLQEPAKKMSTTGGTPQGTVLMVDPPDVIRKKFRSAVADSGHEVRRAIDKPGISNLIEIMSVATGDSMEAVEQRFSGQGYGLFKDAVAEAVIAVINPIRRRYDELRHDTSCSAYSVWEPRVQPPRPSRLSARCTTPWALSGARNFLPGVSTSHRAKLVKAGLSSSHRTLGQHQLRREQPARSRSARRRAEQD
jgi:tryptophanyl-tRNA synthetase